MILNALAVVLSLIALGLLQMKISEHKSMLEEISATEEKKKAAEEKLDVQKKETISKLLLPKKPQRGSVG